MAELIRASSPLLDHAAARYWPCHAAELVTVYSLVTTSARRSAVLGCALPKALLDDLRKSGAIVIVPSALPEAVAVRLDGELPDPHALNFLINELEPAPLRRARTTSRLLWAVGVIGAGLIIASGALMRARHEQNAAAARRTLTDAALMRMQKIDPTANASGLSDWQRRADALHASFRSRPETPDALASLVVILDRWPKVQPGDRSFVRVESLAVSKDGVTINAMLAADASSQPLLQALKSVPQWRLEQSEHHASRSPDPDEDPRARLVLRMVRRQPVVGANLSAPASGQVSQP